MNRRGLWIILPALVFLFSFSGNQNVSSDSRTAEDSLTGTDSLLQFWLSPQVVNNQKPVANTFYFWTTTNELDSVVSQKRLLRTSAPSEHLGELYWDRLFGTIKDNEPISNHLRSGDRQRTRVVWPCYWSILSESYGQAWENQLVKVVLHDSSLIVAFYPDQKERKWIVWDLKGTMIPMNVALARKQHIAAVFISGKNKDHELVDLAPSHMGTLRLRRKEYYRTFVLCNEDMIKSWHHAVPGMQDKIIRDLDYLLLLNAYLGEGLHGQFQGRKGNNARGAWVKPTEKMRVSEMFFATQRLAWQSGEPATQKTTTKIIDLLRERWPKQVKPVERYH